MLETRDVWQDGQAGVSWFAGVHIAGWVVSGQVLNKPGEKRWRERMSLNATWLLHRATVRRPTPDPPADPAAGPVVFMSFCWVLIALPGPVRLSVVC